MAAIPASPPRDGALHPSPPLVLLAAVHAALFVASLAVVAASSGGGHLPSPYAPADEALRFLAAHRDAARWSAFLQLGAAVPLALLAATASSRLHFLGLRAAGVTIALAGGLSASSLLALSALAQWTLSFPDLGAGEPAAVRALQLLAFAAGGPAHVMALGLLVAGVAITSGLGRLLPRWMMTTGVALAVLAELSWTSLVFPAASVLLPVARFPALAWLVVAGALLPARRRGARDLEPRRPLTAPPPGAVRGTP